MTKKPPRWVQVCKIGKPLGLRGDFYVRGQTQHFSSQLDEVFIGESPNLSTPAKVVRQRKHKGKDIIKISLCSDRTELQPHINSKLWTKTKTSTNHIAVAGKSVDPLGWSVMDSQNEVVGTIIERSNFGGGDFGGSFFGGGGGDTSGGFS